MFSNSVIFFLFTLFTFKELFPSIYSTSLDYSSIELHHKRHAHHGHHHNRAVPNMWTILGQRVKSDHHIINHGNNNNNNNNDGSDKNLISSTMMNTHSSNTNPNNNHNNHINGGSDGNMPNSGVGGSGSGSDTNIMENSGEIITTNYKINGKNHHKKTNHIEHEKINSNCPKCQQNRPEIRMTEEQLTELRIEYVKNQILKKLKLTERPQVSLSDLPRPVVEGVTIQQDEDEDEINGIPDDYYGKTTQKVIFPQLDINNCQDAESLGASMCFSIQIPSDIDSQDVESAELWMNKEPHIMDQHVNFVIGEIEVWKEQRLLKPFAIQETNDTEEWVKIDIAGKLKSWIEHNDLTHVIDVTCNTCVKHPSLDLLSLDTDYRPFIVVNTYSNRKIRRQKRSINCSAGVKECCREKLYISFKDIGWDDWIVSPEGYDAYFCRGSCESAATITLSGSHYNSVIRKVLYHQNSNRRAKVMELVPCCTATQFSSLPLFYMDSNNTATMKTLPNMVVEACGCM